MKIFLFVFLLMTGACAKDVSQITIVLRPDAAMRAAKTTSGTSRYRAEFEVFQAKGTVRIGDRESVTIIPDAEENIANQLWPHRIAARPTSEDVLSTGVRVDANIRDLEDPSEPVVLRVGAVVDSFLSKKTLEYTLRLDSRCLKFTCAADENCIDVAKDGVKLPGCYKRNVPATCLEPFDPSGADKGKDHVATEAPQLLATDIAECKFTPRAPMAK